MIRHPPSIGPGSQLTISHPQAGIILTSQNKLGQSGQLISDGDLVKTPYNVLHVMVGSIITIEQIVPGLLTVNLFYTVMIAINFGIVIDVV